MTEPAPELPPAEESPDPCPAEHPTVPGIVCELFANHFDFRLPHTRHANDTVYEWE